MPPIKRKEYNWTLNLMRQKKRMLAKSEEQLLELYHFCDNDEERELIKELLLRFRCFDIDLYNTALQKAVNHICGLGYNEEDMALVAFCHGVEADSSQVVLNDLKVPMAQNGFSNIKTINRFDKIIHEFNKSKKTIKHFVVVDEFIGSGKTLSLRIQEIKRMSLQDITFDFVFLAGMREAVEAGKRSGASVFSVYEMEKGITSYYEGQRLIDKCNLMKSLEGKLAPTINETDLEEYHFGYHGTEALYCRLDRNVPNNVFPVFWWKEDKNGRKRKTLLVRVQNGY